VVEARGRVDGDPARKKLLSTISAVPFDLRGVVLSYGPDKDRVFFTIVQADGSFKPVVRLNKMAGL